MFGTAMTTVGGTGSVYTPTCMQDRNQGMGDAADLLIAVWDGRNRGGAASTVEYAQSQGKNILRIDPLTLG